MPEQSTIIATLSAIIVGSYTWLFKRHANRVDAHTRRITELEVLSARQGENNINLANNVDELRQLVESAHEENRADHQKILDMIFSMK